MKFILKILAAGILFFSSVASLTSCSIPSIADIWIITDGGDLFDKAFNQQVLEGAQDFTETFNKYRAIISNLKGNEHWKNHKMKTRWIISKDSNVSTLQNNYNIATFAKAKVIILAGFNHLEALTPSIQNHYKALGVRFILVDGKIDQPQNVASLTYSSEQSGFLAGLAGAIWLVAHHETYNYNLKMSTFGGIPADTTISYMMGYYWGIYYFNQYRRENNELLTMTNNIRAKIGRDDISINDFYDKFQVKFDKVARQFTNSFDSGTQDAKNVILNLIEANKNALVMPVAGGQTIDLISAIKNSRTNKNAKIIGVDVDQSVHYDYAKNTFITSALKKINKSVTVWLWHAFNLIFDNANLPPKIEVDEHASDYFDGRKAQEPFGNVEYTGLTDNIAIAEIYNDLVSIKKKYWALSREVVKIFQKLVEDLANNHAPDKWEKAWKNDVNKDNPNYKPNFS